MNPSFLIIPIALADALLLQLFWNLTSTAFKLLPPISYPYALIVIATLYTPAIAYYHLTTKPPPP